MGQLKVRPSGHGQQPAPWGVLKIKGIPLKNT
jgi:hypothetical protein